MSDIIVARDPDVIAAEINTIKRQIQEAAIFASIRIGEKLVEAKSMVAHGEWGKWLEDHVEYSQSTANYLMQLYQEYGTGQENLFDTWTNSQTFGRLSYSQHIALLALPFGERQRFAEENNAEQLSARELQKAIRERDAAVSAREDTERQLEVAGGKLLEMERQAFEHGALLGETERARDAAAAALEKAEQEAERLRRELEDIRKDPEIPEDLMARLRREAEEEAAAKAAEAAEKKVAAAQKAAAEAEAREKTAREDAQRARAGESIAIHELDRARKLNRMQDPDFAVFQAMYVQLQENWNRCVGAAKKVSRKDGASAESCRRALAAVMEKFRADLEREAQEMEEETGNED